MRKVFKNYINECGQVAVEYALVMVIMAIAASLIYILTQGFVDQTFYGSFTEVRTMGFERTIANPFP